MIDFPEVVLKEVFDFLGIRDRLRMRSTCKKWKFVVDTRCHQRNVCIYTHTYPYNERWCFSDQKVAEEEMVHLKYDHVSRAFNLRMQFFQNLQKVYLFRLEDKVDLFLEEIKHLTRLRVLLIEAFRFSYRTLNSSTLKMLSLKGYGLGNLQLNTPNLSSLALWNNRDPFNDIVNLEFGFPLKLNHLQCTEFTENLGSQLKNLETLVCNKITFDFRLNEFESLTKAELWSLEAFRTVVNEKRRLNRTNLQVLASGFKEEIVANEPPEIQEQFFCKRLQISERGRRELSRSFLEKAESNQWNMAGSIPWKFDLNVRTFSSFASRIPRTFFEKFSIDRILYFKESAFQIDQSALLELLARSRPREFICTSKNPLSLDGLEQLSRIQSIKVFYGFCIEIGDCLLNLKNLEYLNINSPKISIDFCRLFKELKLFHHLHFYSNEPTEFHLYIDFYNFSPEDREANGIPMDALYSLHYYYGSVIGANAKIDKYFRNLDELIEGVKGLRESFFI